MHQGVFFAIQVQRVIGRAEAINRSVSTGSQGARDSLSAVWLLNIALINEDRVPDSEKRSANFTTL